MKKLNPFHFTSHFARLAGCVVAVLFIMTPKSFGQPPAIRTFSLAVSSGTLVPAFSTGGNFYRDTVPNDNTTIRITPTGGDTHTTIKVNDSPVVSGTPSLPINLQVGKNKVRVKVIAQNGNTREYIIEVVRSFERSDALLSNLTISQGALLPGFSPGVTFYRDTVNTGKNTSVYVSVTPTADDPLAKIKVNGKKVASGHASQLVRLHNESIYIKSHTPIRIIVTAQNGNTREYRIKVMHPHTAHNADLAALTVNHGTLKKNGSKVYKLSVANNISSITVTPTAADVNAIITISGVVVESGTASAPISLPVGADTIKVKVTAQNQTKTRVYTIFVKRAAAGLSGDEILPVIAADSIIKKPASNTLLTLTVYPNPASTTFNLKILNGDSHSNAILKVRDLQGKVVYQYTGSVNDIFSFGQSFASGIYIVEIVNGNFSKQVKVIKSLR